MTAPRSAAVAFPSGDVELRGELFLPARTSAPPPAVVVGGSWTTVRGQMADRYARAMAERGIAALSFDFTGFGASDGEPRDVEAPWLKARDLRSALDALARDGRIDGDRVGILGICASAGYAAVAAASGDPLPRALGFVAPWLHDEELVRELYGGADEVQRRIDDGRAARQRYVQTGEVQYVPAQSTTDQDAAMPMETGYYEDPDRGGIPEWTNRFALMAWPGWLEFDPIAAAPDIRVPTLIVQSPDAAVPTGAQRFLGALAAPEKAIEWLEGTQFDFYDHPEHVAVASDRVADHFTRHL